VDGDGISSGSLDKSSVNLLDSLDDLLVVSNLLTLLGVLLGDLLVVFDNLLGFL